MQLFSNNMEEQKKTEAVEAPKPPKKVKPELDYIANNNTFVVKAEPGKTVTVEVNGEEWGKAEAVEGIATVVLKRELPETYTYKIR